jgi:zinc and cadmium transporter
MINMTTFFWIIGTCLAGGFLSLLFAFLFFKKANINIVTNMVSLSVGTMLGAVFLEILPHALEQATDYHDTMFIVLIGLLIFFTLEKLLIWRHCHGDHCETHSHDAQLKHKKSGSLVLIGDLSHNFIDGMLIATAFLFEIQLGLVTALAIYAHQIPQEMGNISIFVHKGLKKNKAILLNVIANISMTAGAVITYILIDSAGHILPVLLAFTASNLIYVAVSDLIPGLHKRTQIKESSMQIAMILVGVFIIYIFHLFLH